MKRRSNKRERESEKKKCYFSPGEKEYIEKEKKIRIEREVE